MKLYIILWRGTYDKRWQCDSIHETETIAQAKLAYERLDHPTWTFEMVEVDLTAKETLAEAEARLGAF